MSTFQEQQPCVCPREMCRGCRPARWISEERRKKNYPSRAELVTLPELVVIRRALTGRFALTTMGAGPFHSGHFRLLAACTAFAPWVAVVVMGDQWCRRKNQLVFMPLQQRLEMISYVRGVSFVTPYEPNDGIYDVNWALELLHPDVFVKGGDRIAGQFGEYECCRQLGIEAVYPPSCVAKLPGEASSEILQHYVREHDRLERGATRSN